MKKRRLLLMVLIGVTACDFGKPIDTNPPYCPASCYLSKTEKVATDGWNTSYWEYKCVTHIYSTDPCPASAYPDMGTSSTPPDLGTTPDLSKPRDM